jgi:hypothetical protein
MNNIRPEMRIGEILELYPELVAVFSANGFPAVDESALVSMLGAESMLKTVLKVKGYDEQVFIQLLEEKIQENKAFLVLTRSAEAVKEKVDFLGNTFCPVKAIFKECFEETLAQYLAATGDKEFQYFVPSACTGGDDPYENLWRVENIDDFPDVAVASGFGDFFRQEFVNRFVKKGYFKSCCYDKVNKNFASAEYQDPEGWYTVYSAQPTVILVDCQKLGDLPVPKTWSDILNPIYKKML